MVSYKDTGASPFPVIVACGPLNAILGIYIVADHQMLFQVNGGIVEAVVALFACYYVFMIQYPVSLNNLFLYLQKCLFNIPDSQKLPTSVITFVNSLVELCKPNCKEASCEGEVLDAVGSLAEHEEQSVPEEDNE